jgi:hypothetical protein
MGAVALASRSGSAPAASAGWCSSFLSGVAAAVRLGFIDHRIVQAVLRRVRPVSVHAALDAVDRGVRQISSSTHAPRRRDVEASRGSRAASIRQLSRRPLMAELDQHVPLHGHAHHHASPAFDGDRFGEVREPGIARIGIGGPVGSGKTALIEALVPLLLEAGRRRLVVTNDIFTKGDAEHVRSTLSGVLAPERVVGVETGSCPHSAVRDDPSMNLAAVADLTRRFHGVSDSGGRDKR